MADSDETGVTLAQVLAEQKATRRDIGEIAETLRGQESRIRAAELDIARLQERFTVWKVAQMAYSTVVSAVAGIVGSQR